MSETQGSVVYIGEAEEEKAFTESNMRSDHDQEDKCLCDYVH
jgi:hypothetical protein